MSSLFQRVSRFRPPHFRACHRNAALLKPNESPRRHSSISTASGKKTGRLGAYDVQAVPPVFTQTPPAWVRYAWPIIIANALLMGSAVDITWNHWATLVEDLEEIGERNRAAASGPTTSPPDAKPDQVSEKQPIYHWEQRSIWLRAAFCGIYGAGWALSTAYLLKYRQTYITKLRFFRAPSDPSKATSMKTDVDRELKRFIHVSTASNPAGYLLSSKELIIQDGRNETELVIRYRDVPSSDGKGPRRRKRRDYWYISLTDALVRGATMGDVVNARDNLIWTWDGAKNAGFVLTPDGVEETEVNSGSKGEKKRQEKRQFGWQSGPVLKK